MRFGDRGTSDNVESQRGQSFGGGGLGGAGAGLLFSLVASRFGIGGVIVLVIVMALFGGLGNLFGGGQQAVSGGQGSAGKTAANICAEDSTTRFSCQVLLSTEQRWGELFQAAGQRYEAPRMVVYTGGGRSGCGSAQSEMGPFYCPADHRIYIDTSFFNELARQYGAPGDFAQAYVIAHEVGHHIQTITGTADRIRQAQSAVREGEANALQVRMELQADCLAGVWASRERAAMEPGDIEEGMRAAAAIGDDTLQRANQGTVVPESFTHGTAAQRQEALMRGYQGGNAEACAGYTQGI